LKLESIVLVSRLQILKIRDLLTSLLGINNDLIKTIDLSNGINIDLGISRITDPKVNPLPTCLTDTITGSISTSGTISNIVGDINSGINTINDLTSSATPFLSSSAESFLSNVNNGIEEVNKLMNNIMGNLVAPEDKVLFAALDKFHKFISDSDFVTLYKEWIDTYNCLRDNCKPLEPFLIGKEFLYYDKSLTKFIIPISLSNNKVIISKFFETLTNNDISTINKIQIRYDKYLRDKKYILDMASSKASSNGIQDNKNPFLSVSKLF